MHYCRERILDLARAVGAYAGGVPVLRGEDAVLAFAAAVLADGLGPVTATWLAELQHEAEQ